MLPSSSFPPVYQQDEGGGFDPTKSDRYWESPATVSVVDDDLRSCNQMPFKNEFQELLPVPNGGSGSGIFTPGSHHQHQLLQPQLQFGDEQAAPFGSINEAQAKQEMLAYQALCQAELMRSEKTPHRTQFQRENHILAERQRREEMNEKFTALKALLPKSTKKDKASIVGETINYVLELEKKLKELQSTANSKTSHRHKRRALPAEANPERRIATSSNADQGENLSVKPADIELQSIGGQAIIKMVCMRSPGLALRILATLESCQAQVIQSNIATLGSHAILFFTVELSSSNTSTEELIATLELAASRRE
ncbi:hypothetical protein SELMODRAFT_418047 [Selaginella moellendorffii]|uniref:BHLH domain-containing protein n=1 Tax=Selaginella moellendorffii TaxID=88036 RepID=D8S4H3_SELML|nr:hypothetical protein SELMODRAFT_418047 [Selaginella moellendorffii]